MATTFSDLKKNREKQADQLLQKMTATNQPTAQKDETYWTYTPDEAGNASATFRFLSAPEGEDEPYVQIFSHAFKHPSTNKWYIEKSLTTLGQKDPVGEYNGVIWNEGPAGQAQARRQKRDLKYHCNIYMIKDTGNPENDGKVFRYKFGKKILDMISAGLKPEDEEDVAFNAFDMWDGANFRFKAHRVTVQQDGKSVTYPNYDKSKFESPKPLFDDDDKIEAVWRLAYPLKELIDPSQFKTYDELKKRLNEVLGTGPASASQARSNSIEETFLADEDEKEVKPTAASTEEPEDWFKEFESLKADDDDEPPF